MHLYPASNPEPLVSASTEQKMIQACLNGDRTAQKQLFDSLAPKMLSLCMRYTGDRETAEDLLQEGFIVLFQKLDTFKGEGSFEGWARRIFSTQSLMYLRKKDALKMSEDLEDARSLSSDTPTALENIGYKELMKLITALPPGFRTVFNMYVIDGYSHKEIAEQLGITETTSRTQLSRAKTWLQKKIQESNNITC